MESEKDDLWTEFEPVWNEMLRLGAGEMLQIAGGYGLFLKQKWLLNNSADPIIIPLVQWVEPTPRATNDFDFLLGLEFIGNQAINTQIPKILEANGFTITEKKLGQRWQFVKALSNEKTILAELHSPTPETGAPNLRAEKIRIKHRPSLGESGVHGRHNKEAIGCDINPFRFELDSVTLAVPNPVSWSVMKLTAMDDFWQRSINPEKTAESRARARRQAEKHALDVCRAVAMMTIKERNRKSEIVEKIALTAPYQKAATIFTEAFLEKKWALEFVVGDWSDDDIEIIVSELKDWFVDSIS